MRYDNTKLAGGGAPLSSREEWSMSDEGKFLKLYSPCNLCPRSCRVDRLGGATGYCFQTSQLRIAWVGAHFGEEPPITGTRGSGTVFFSGCSLRCKYCQNYQISRENLGKTWEVETLAAALKALWEAKGVHNVNFVTPDHFFPHVIIATMRMRDTGLGIPIVYNLSGYQSIASLRLVEPFVDVYLPDFKYGDYALANRLSNAPNYPSICLDAIAEMVRQKGFLHPWPWDHGSESLDESVTACKGVLVRHLVLPGQIENSTKILTMLLAEFGPDLPISLMSQYVPTGNDLPKDMATGVSREEFHRVLDYALELGFRRVVFQPWEDMAENGQRPFLPDFSKEDPFPGNRDGGTQASISRAA